MWEYSSLRIMRNITLRAMVKGGFLWLKYNKSNKVVSGFLVVKVK